MFELIIIQARVCSCLTGSRDIEPSLSLNTLFALYITVHEQTNCYEWGQIPQRHECNLINVSSFSSGMSECEELQTHSKEKEILCETVCSTGFVPHCIMVKSPKLHFNSTKVVSLNNSIFSNNYNNYCTQFRNLKQSFLNFSLHAHPCNISLPT